MNVSTITSAVALLALGFVAHAQVVPSPAPPTAMACAFNTTPPTVASGQATWLQCSATGSIRTTTGTFAALSLAAQASTTAAPVTVVDGGRYNCFAWGTFGGATAQLQFSPDDGPTWVDIPGVSFTVNGAKIDIPLSAGTIRFAITGGSGVSINAICRSA